MTKKLSHQKALNMGVVGFVIMVFLSDWVLDNYTLTGWKNILVVLLPAIPLTYWWGQYPRLLKEMDELEQSIELEALAKGVGVGVWVITIIALLATQISGLKFPLFMVAPTIALFYGIARILVVRKYK